MAATTREALDLRAAADELGVHYQTAYRWVRSGRLPAVRVDGRYLVERAAIEGVTQERSAIEERPAPSRSRLDRSAERLHALLVDGDEPGARQLVRRLVDEGTSIVELVQRVLVPPLARIGAEWHDGELSIWVEHRATAIVERLLGDIVPNPRGRRRGTAVVAAVAGDRHSLPTTMAAVALRDDHWHVQHLGADVPVTEIIRCSDDAGADLVVITTTNPVTHGDARRAVEQVVAATGAHALLGGPGRSLDELVEHARDAARAGRGTLP